MLSKALNGELIACTAYMRCDISADTFSDLHLLESIMLQKIVRNHTLQSRAEEASCHLFSCCEGNCRESRYVH